MLKAFVILIAAFGLITAALWTIHHFVFVAETPAQKRTKAMREIARSRSLHFNRLSDYEHAKIYRSFKVFHKGGGGTCRNTMEGYCQLKGKPHKFKMGDFEYTITTDDGTSYFQFSYLCVHVPYDNVPEIYIRKERLFDKLVSSLGLQDINFESAQFSRKYYVKSPDRKFAYSVITPSMMEDALDYPLPDIDLKDGIICVSDGLTTWKPEEFLQKLDPVADFLGLWPNHVVESLPHRIT